MKMVHKRVQRAPTNHCKLAIFQPIRSETETSKNAAYTRFPALCAGCIFIRPQVLSVHCIVIVYCDWAYTITLGLALWLPSLVYAIRLNGKFQGVTLLIELYRSTE